MLIGYFLCSTTRIYRQSPIYARLDMEMLGNRIIWKVDECSFLARKTQEVALEIRGRRPDCDLSAHSRDYYFTYRISLDAIQGVSDITSIYVSEHPIRRFVVIQFDVSTQIKRK